MIIIMNILISIIGLVGIIIARNMVWEGTGMGIKLHLLILLIKLIVSSIIIGLFLIYTEKYLWSFFILSGIINLVIFHIIEAFITQKILINHMGINV